MASQNDNDEPKIEAPALDVAPTRSRGHAPLPASATAARPPTLAADDPRERARLRAAEIMEHNTGEEGDDEFFIPPRIVPEGWAYEWKRHTLLGAQDPSYQVQLARGGWDAVPVTRHPEMMPDNYTGGESIERKGMILMERPLEISARARANELRKARSQVQQKETQLRGAPAGENSPFAPDNKGSPLVNINKSFERMPVPKDS